MERKKSKNRKRRLLILLIALFFTTIMFTTTTYAWFTANKTVTVSKLTVNVAAQNGIQISADGTNWKSIVQTEDLKGVKANTYSGAMNTNQIPESMEPVSTVGTIDSDGHMEMFYGTVGSNAGGDYILTATKETDTSGTTGRYIVFDLFFKVNAATDLFLTTNSGVTTTDTTDTGIKNASRVGFVILGNTDAGSSLTAIQSLAGSGASTPKYIWEPNYDVHTAASVAHAHDTYGETTTVGPDAAAVPYAGVKAAIADTANVLVQTSSALEYTTRNSDYFATVTPNYQTKDSFSANQQIFSLQKGVTKVRIYMWIEGQDVDCQNAASGGTISYDLQITTPETTNP
ncbi:MAG: hypothetical protein IJ568_03715 [Bacilli bacterium]|nr:hypothetical protein [Bacilli bacterium]